MRYNITWLFVMMEQLRLGSKKEVTKGIEGATKFVSGKGSGGDFKDV